MQVAWDTSHDEFTIEDYYYFSKLKKFAAEEGIEILDVHKFSELVNYDTIVFNYPEREFDRGEESRIKLWARRGKNLIFTAYYSNIDGVAENINKVLRNISGIKVNYDLVCDDQNNYGDEKFPVAFCGELKVVMPCSASISGGTPFVTGKSVFGAREGRIFVLGTCVFWDNYSIELGDNREFSLRLLRGEI